MPLSPEAQYQIRKAEQKLAARATRREAMRAAAERAAEVLLEDYGARRVWLYGSVLQAWFHEASDLDLAVEGVAPERVGEAWDCLQNVLDVPVDLVSLDDADESLRRKVIESGEVLRDAQATRRG
jgi:uncharacterized protein